MNVITTVVSITSQDHIARNLPLDLAASVSHFPEERNANQGTWDLVKNKEMLYPMELTKNSWKVTRSTLASLALFASSSEMDSQTTMHFIEGVSLKFSSIDIAFASVSQVTRDIEAVSRFHNANRSSCWGWWCTSNILFHSMCNIDWKLSHVSLEKRH